MLQRNKLIQAGFPVCSQIIPLRNTHFQGTTLMTKIQTPEQFAALGQANLESLMSLAGSAIARAERLAELNLNTVRSVLEDSVATTRKLAEAKNPQELANLQAELTKPMIDKAVAYARSVQEIATEGQNEVSSLFEASCRDEEKIRTFGV